MPVARVGLVLEPLCEGNLAGEAKFECSSPAILSSHKLEPLLEILPGDPCPLRPCHRPHEHGSQPSPSHIFPPAALLVVRVVLFPAGADLGRQPVPRLPGQPWSGRLTWVLWSEDVSQSQESLVAAGANLLSGGMPDRMGGLPEGYAVELPIGRLGDRVGGAPVLGGDRPRRPTETPHQV